MYVVTAVEDASGHVDTVSQDETHTAKHLCQEERGGKKEEGEEQHGPIVPSIIITLNLEEEIP